MNAVKVLILSLSLLGVTSGTRTFDDDFRRAQAFTTTPGHNGWTIKDTSAAGTPTYLCTEEGAVLTLAATSEAEIVTLYHNDVKAFPLGDIVSIEWAVKVSGIDSTTTLVMGIASSQNDTADSVQEHAWFRMEGSASTTALVAETDDNTTNNDDKATGATLSTTTRRLKVDFSNGLDDVRFYVDGSRRASATTFDMQAATDGLDLQPFVQLQKASGTGTPSVTIRSCIITYRYSF
ncbi:MAG: hypothetical protein IPM64_17950 [Phycisphaerales bacterium]|nr:hypothetical protein [Phycisphaerales bacterium]